MGKILTEREAEQRLGEITELKPSDFYKVGGEVIPSARAYRYFANKKYVSTSTVSIEYNDKFTKVTVAGWVGDRDHPQLYTDATSVIDYEVRLKQWILEKIRKGDANFEYDKETGIPKAKNVRGLHQAIKQLYSIRNFAPRIATTQAKSIVLRELITGWVDEEMREVEEQEIREIEEEASERKKKREKSSNGNDNGKMASEVQTKMFYALLNQLPSEEQEEIKQKSKDWVSQETGFPVNHVTEIPIAYMSKIIDRLQKKVKEYKASREAEENIPFEDEEGE